MTERPEVVAARTRDGNEELQRLLAKRGIGAVAVETIALDNPGEWTQFDQAISRVSDHDWVAFTSPRAVAVFDGRLKAHGMEARGIGAKFAAVGSGTASALREIGVDAAYVPAEFLTSALGEGLPGAPGTRVLLLRADIGDKKLVTTLQDRGFEVEDVAAYHTRFVSGPVDPGLVKSAKVVAFASPSEVEGFRRRLEGGLFAELAAQATAVCIGPVTARAAERNGFRSVVFAREHTLEGLADKVGEMMVHA